MLKKKLLVSSTDPRKFVEVIIELVKKGATLPDNTPVFKGMMMRATLEIDEDVYVEESPHVRVVPVTKDERQKYIKESELKTPVVKEKEDKEEPPKRAAKKAAKKTARKQEVEQG